MVYGEKRRAVTFNLDVPLERELYELSKTMPFSSMVKKYLLRELRRRRAPAGQGSVTVSMGRDEA